MSRRVRARRAARNYKKTGPEPAPADGLPEREEINLEGMTVGELRDFARVRQIIITGRLRKAEIIEKIRERLR